MENPAGQPVTLTTSELAELRTDGWINQAIVQLALKYDMFVVQNGIDLRLKLLVHIFHTL